MTGDLGQVSLGVLTVSVQLRAELAPQLHNTPAESALREHVVFHVPNDYVRLQAQRFRVRKRVADQQPLGTIPKRPERLFLQLFIHTVAGGYEIRERQQPKSRAAKFVIDFQMI